MLKVYTNKTELLTAANKTEVSRLDPVDTNLLDKRHFAVTLKDNSIPNLELHVYTPDGVYVTGNHKSFYSIANNDTTSQEVAYQHISLNTKKELDVIGITRGQYKVVYNLFDNICGSYDGQKLFIKEISPSRREVRLQLANQDESAEVTQQFNNLKSRWEYLTTNDIFDSFILNFGFNETYQIINARFENIDDTYELIVKLYAPLSLKYGEKLKVWISEEVITPIAESISIIPEHVAPAANTIAPPNFEIDAYEGGSVATDFKTWNELLAANVSTSQQLIDTYFSGSLSGIKLNINYKNFNNFIHYSSATERVKNFRYKLELIEHFSSQLSTLLTSPPTSIISTNLIDVYTKRNQVVSGFDDFEKYLFFESEESKLYTHFDLPTDTISPWPKKIYPDSVDTWEQILKRWQTAAVVWNGNTPDQSASINTIWEQISNRWEEASLFWNGNTLEQSYNYFTQLNLTTSQAGIEYYANLLEQAELFDANNIHKLQNTVPIHIQESSDGEQFNLFVNMIAQHFDIIWTYVNNLTTTKTREEHPKDGMPDDLLYHVASSMGFNLLNGASTSELWKYALGVDDAGNAINTVATTGYNSISDQSSTKEIWRRIVNNLPYILKSKGTSRSIKALLTCFGIPSTVLTIKEYGGPSTFTDDDHFPEYEHEVYHKAWNSNGLTTLTLPVSQYNNGTGTNDVPNTLEFRFKTDNNYTYVSGSTYTIFSSGNTLVDLQRENNYNNLGKIRFSDIDDNTIEVGNLEIFDNSWHLLTVDQTNNIITVKVTKSLYSKQIYINSGSTNEVYPVFSNGNPIIFGEEFKGHIHEIRLWSGSLHDDVLIQHASSPNTYTYNYDIDALATGAEADAPYRHLLQRFILSDNNFKDSNKFYSSHPNQTINNSGSAQLGYITISDTANFVLESFEETYYTPSPSLGGSSLYTNKVRIESSSLDTNKRLNTQTRIEKSSYDRYSLDSNRLGVYFSPQTQINEDIFNQLGYFEIDDYIGDPGDTYKETYSALNNFAIQYWKKYENRNDFEAYFRALEIYDFTLFKYIKKLLPQRTNAVLGLVIEPNVLERNRVRINRKPVIKDLAVDAIIDETENTFYMETQNLFGVVDDEIITTNIDYDAKKLAVIDNENVIGTTINYDAKKLAIVDNENVIGTTINYDAKKLAVVDGESSIVPTINYDAEKLAVVDGESSIVPTINYDAEKLLILDNSYDVSILYDTKKYGRLNRLPLYNVSYKARNTGLIDRLPLYNVSYKARNTGLLDIVPLYNGSYKAPNTGLIDIVPLYNGSYKAPNIGNITTISTNWSGDVITGILYNSTDPITGITTKRRTKSIVADVISNSPVIQSQTITQLQSTISNSPVIQSQTITQLQSTITKPLIINKSTLIPSLNGNISNISYYNMNKTGYKWIQVRTVGKYTIHESGSYKGVTNLISGSRLSINSSTAVFFYSTSYSASINRPYSSSFINSDINLTPGIGFANARYDGCKLTGPGINIDTSVTTDGGPVVTRKIVNPNVITFADGQLTIINSNIELLKKPNSFTWRR